MKFVTYHASVRGPTHQRLGQPNQDAVLTRRWRRQWLMVVCDGMGSRPYADVGSKMACYAVRDTVLQSHFAISDRDLIQAVYKNWLDRLGSIKPNDAITTCLFAWGLSTGETRLFQLGDGAIMYQTDHHVRLNQRPTQNFSNETTGLGLSRKYSDWITERIYLQKADQGVVLMTDGISDDLVGEESFLAELQPSLVKRSARMSKRWLVNQLMNWSTPHHTDDKTIAFIYRTA